MSKKKSAGSGRKPLTYGNKDNYFPLLIRSSSKSDLIQQEVIDQYAKHYASGKRTKSGDVIGGVGGAMAGGMGSSVNVSIPQPYMPEFASPDRLFYPSDPRQAMKYWRYFHALDPIAGSVLDIYGELLQDTMELEGSDLTNEMRDAYQKALDNTKAPSQMKWLVTGFLVDGEVVPHLIWSDEDECWQYLGFQDPINLKVIDIPFANTDPVIEVEVSKDVRKILTSSDPRYERFRNSVPNDFLEMIRQGRNIPLDTEKNVTFLPRRLSAYDIRGVSIFSRLWRVMMLEDSIFNVSIQTARRHGAPIKVIKLGDPSKGITLGPEQEAKIRQLLTIAETDPHAWLVWNYAINFEAWGTTDRALSIRNEWETIERIKLIALGVSKAFLTGEITYCVFNNRSNVLLNSGLIKQIDEVTKGDLVADRFGMPQKVKEVLTFDSPDKGIEITAFGGKKLFVTENHRFPVFAFPKICACGCGRELPKRKRPANNRLVNCFSFIKQHHRGSKHKSIWKEYRDGESLITRVLDDYNPQQELEARDIRRGDYLMIPRKFEVDNILVNKETKAKARLLGYYIAEGSITYNNVNKTTRWLVWSFGNAEKEKWYAEDTVSCLRVMGLDGQINQYDCNHNCYSVSGKGHLEGRKEFMTWLEENAGKGALDKLLSKEVMHWPLELKEELIKGMFRGDGHYHQRLNKKNKTSVVTDVMYSSISEKLVKQLELILAQLGYPSTVWCDTAEHRKIWGGGSLGKKDLWRLAVCGRRGVSLLKLIWGDVKPVWKKVCWKDNITKNSMRGERKDAWVDDDYVYIRVKDVKLVVVNKKKYPKVYSLSVEGTHSYTIDNIASFNSSAEKGLQVFLARLKGLRNFFEEYWWYPRFFRLMAEKNGWERSSHAEVAHRIKIKRSTKEKIRDHRYIVPNMVWSNSLDPQKKDEMIRVLGELSNSLGIRVSKGTAMAMVGLNFEEEAAKVRKEELFEAELLKKFGPFAKDLQKEEPAEGSVPPSGGGMGGGGGGNAPEEGALGEGEVGEEPVVAESPPEPVQKQQSRKKKRGKK